MLKTLKIAATAGLALAAMAVPASAGGGAVSTDLQLWGYEQGDQPPPRQQARLASDYRIYGKVVAPAKCRKARKITVFKIDTEDEKTQIAKTTSDSLGYWSVHVKASKFSGGNGIVGLYAKTPKRKVGQTTCGKDRSETIGVI